MLRPKTYQREPIIMARIYWHAEGKGAKITSAIKQWLPGLRAEKVIRSSPGEKVLEKAKVAKETGKRVKTLSVDELSL